MNKDVLALAARLTGDRQPYALATVVRSERPSSGRPGNTALITPDGVMHGWIGGSCTRSEVIRHALDALDRGSPTLLAFGFTSGRSDDLVHVPMSCSSGGKVEVHVNPVLPAPVLLVAGASPVALAVVRLGSAMGYTTVVGPADDGMLAEAADDAVPDLAKAARSYAERPGGARLFGVVATMGRSDEPALVDLAAARPDYLGVIASPTRMAEVRRILAAEGLDEEQIARVRGPAGLDIGAETPEEIAVSILAEIVERTARLRDARDETPPAADQAPEPRHSGAGDTETQATDPVCGMTVSANGAPSSVYEGEAIYFCCDGCRTRFEANPAAYV